METKSLRHSEIDDLVRFIRLADIPSARGAVIRFMQRGERISREIVSEYQQLERRRA